MPAAIGESLRAAARRWGTPVAVTDTATLQAAAAELREAFPDPWLRAFSVKANDVAAIVRELGRLGLDANVVTRGEWAIARRAGLPNDRITLEGVGKSAADLAAAVRATADGVPLRWIAVESPDEAADLRRLASVTGAGASGRPRPDVLLRFNPDVTPETLAGLAVGLGRSKFGMTADEIGEAIDVGGGADGPLRWRGLHLHVGSQLLAVDAWRDAVRRALALLALVRGGLPTFDTLDVGGGFPVAGFGSPGTVPPPARFAAELPALLEPLPAGRRPDRLAVEPGRFLVAGAGWLVARVIHVRTRRVPGPEPATLEPTGTERGPELAVPVPMVDRQVVLDVGMTELLRPALYGARHAVVALTSLGRRVDGSAAGPEPAPARVEGPLCESTDSLGSHDLPPLRRGDLVAIADTGAYAASLGSTYNGRPRPPQVLLRPGGDLELARRRGSVAALG